MDIDKFLENIYPTVKKEVKKEIENPSEETVLKTLIQSASRLSEKESFSKNKKFF